jgi:hypothetical protein
MEWLCGNGEPVSPMYNIGPRERHCMTLLLDSYSNSCTVGLYSRRNITYLFNIKSITVKSLNCKIAHFKRNYYDEQKTVQMGSKV